MGRLLPDVISTDPKQMAVVLIGFMGAGKTSVGRALSRHLGWPFEDLDDRIESREARRIDQIFLESGEPDFRRAESAALRELLTELPGSPRVVALGGGAFARPENVELLKAARVRLVFLDGAADELMERCDREGRVRPMRRSPRQFRELYEQRRASYLRADFRIDTTGKSVEMVAMEVACSLGLE